MITLSLNWNYDFSVKYVHVPPDKPYSNSYQLDIECNLRMVYFIERKKDTMR